MEKEFNTEGPCNPNEHYMIDAMRRLGQESMKLIRRRKYFMTHAARQSGKTTFLLKLASMVKCENNCHAVYCSLEKLEDTSNADEGIPAIVSALKQSLLDFGLPNADSFAEDVDLKDYRNLLQTSLAKYCKQLDKPLVLLFDESDCLINATLISFLRQLRSGCNTREIIPFAHSLTLVGMRDIRGCRAEYRHPSKTLGGGSPFNIASSFSLRNFTKDEIAELYAQHTECAGQIFQKDAIELAWEQTQGQPWLVNAVAKVAVESVSPSPQTPITPEIISEAVQQLILMRATHFDSLMSRPKEDQVRRVMEPIIIGEKGAIDPFSDDYRYVKDLGLITDQRGKVEPANPIYGEIIVRTLNRGAQEEIANDESIGQPPFYQKDGVVDMERLLRGFQSFWRENSDIWLKKYDYQEAAPHLVMQAFLQRLVNGGGRIDREMAAGSGRVDLCVSFHGRKYPIELKIRRSDNTRAEPVVQTARYMDRLGCAQGWVVIFDQRANVPWSGKLYIEKGIVDGKTVTVVGC